MDEPAASMKKYGLFRSTQEDILALIPGLLGGTIYNDQVSADSFARLWQLTRHESTEVSGPAQRTLKTVIGYQNGKSTYYNGRFLEFVEKLSEAASSFDGSFTPLDLVMPLLVHEYDIE